MQQIWKDKLYSVCARIEEDVLQQQGQRSSYKCRRWLVCVTACLSMILDIGFIFSFGTLYVNIMTTFSVGRSKAATVQSILMAVRFGTGMISGLVVQRFGTLFAGVLGSCLASTGLLLSYFATSIFMLNITLGFILAFGSSCLYIASSLTIGQYFSSEKRHILLSVQSAAGGVGGMVYPFILKYLSDTFGLKGSLLLVGGIYLQLLPAALLWRDVRFQNKKVVMAESTIEKVTKDKESRTDSSECLSGENATNDAAKNDDLSELISSRREISHEVVIAKEAEEVAVSKRQETVFKNLKHLANNSTFVLFAVGLAIAYSSLRILFIFVVDFFLDAGLSEADATLGLLLVNLFSIFGRLLPGLIIQSKHVPVLSVPICASVLLSAVMAGIVVVQGLPEHLFLFSLVGIPYGVFVSVFSVTTLKIVGIERLSTAIGVHFTLNGVGSALAGPISGSLRDYTSSYTYPFWIASGAILIGGIFFTFALQMRRKKNRGVTERTPLLQKVNYRLDSSTIF